MAILKILTYPDPILKIKASSVESFDKKAQKFFDDMIETMYDDRGVGLAAPQVGVSKRVLIASPLNKVGSEVVICNPVIELARGTQMGPEGCLSFPGAFTEIPRSQWIRLRYQDRSGKWVTQELEDFFARIVQHEMDHLEGILLIDRVNLIAREQLLTDYAEQSEMHLSKKKKKK